jgi:hypothetical protein
MKDNTQSTQPTERMFEAYKFLGLVPTKDQKALNELFGRWTAEQSEVSFPQFAYNCRNEKAALSNELNTLFTNMDIHSEHDSEETESEDDSIPPYSSDNFEDVLHKTQVYLKVKISSRIKH